jgi:hypothetical protein
VFSASLSHWFYIFDIFQTYHLEATVSKKTTPHYVSCISFSILFFQPLRHCKCSAPLQLEILRRACRGDQGLSRSNPIHNLFLWTAHLASSSGHEFVQHHRSSVQKKGLPDSGTILAPPATQDFSLKHLLACTLCTLSLRLLSF